MERREGWRSQWKTALLKMRVTGGSEGGVNVRISAFTKFTHWPPGSALESLVLVLALLIPVQANLDRAFRSMSSLPSIPVIFALSHVSDKTAVLFPGPHPKSKIRGVLV